MEIEDNDSDLSSHSENITIELNQQSRFNDCLSHDFENNAENADTHFDLSNKFAKKKSRSEYKSISNPNIIQYSNFDHLDEDKLQNIREYTRELTKSKKNKEKKSFTF